MLGVINASAKNLVVSWIVQRHLRGAGERFLRGRLVDIGCGTKPYQPLLAPFVAEHVGVDHEDSPHDRSSVDLTGTAYAIPSPDASFDSALCSAVLEHLEEPARAIAECRRVLRTGAHAVYTVPFIWHLHEEPRDFYRYTKYGLRHLFETNGFDVVEITALSGFWLTFGQLFVYNLYRLHRGPLRWIPVIPAIGLVVQGASWLLDRLDRTEQWTWMYGVVARAR